MTASHDHDLLRSALHAAANSIEPGPEGLERIQARLRRPRPLPLAWAEGAWTKLALRIPDRLWAWLYDVTDAARQGWNRLGPSAATSPSRRRMLGWARPALLAAAVVIMAAGVYAAFDVQQPASTTNNQGPNGTVGNTKPGGSAGPGGATSHSPASRIIGPGGTASPSSRPSSKRSKSTHSQPASGAPPTTPPAGTSTSPPPDSPSPSDSSSPSPTPSPTPSPSDTSQDGTSVNQ